MIYSQYALFMLRVFGLVQNAAFKYYAYSFNDSSLANSFEYLMGKLPVDPVGHMRTAKLPGHIVIGALFPIHRKTHGSDSCGEIWEQYGIHRSEVALQTVNEINQKSLIAPGLKLGIHIRDDCWTERIAMEQSIEFIRDVIGRKDGDEVCKVTENVVTPSGLSASTELTRVPAPAAEVHYPPNLAAVIGPGSSDPSIAVQNLLQVFHIPQIGYSATSSHLSDKIEFKYYMRVVPSDGWQARALVDLVRYFNWTYIAVVYSSGSYGDRGQEEIKNYIDEIGRGTLCTAIHEKIKSLSPEGDYDALLHTINSAKPKPQVAICFCEGATITEILKATRRYKKRQESLLEKGQNSSYQSIQWIGSDSWSDRRDVVSNYENEAFGGISLKIYSPLVPKFDDHFLNLSPFTNKLNPWFVDFWEQKFKCSLRETSFALYRRICTGNESLSEDYEQDPKLSQVINSIYTVAYALRNMYRNVCYKWLKRHNRRKNMLNSTFVDSKRLLCPQMNPINGSLLYQYMRKVRFVDFFGQEIYFDEHGDPPARYDILNYQGPEKGYIKVGEWKQYEIRDKSKNGSGNRIKMGTQLSIDEKLLIWHTNVSAATHVFQSICSEPCKVGEYKKIQDALQCCWNCIPCLPHEYVLNENTCKACPLGSWPTSDRLACYELIVEYMRWNSAESLVAMILAVLGIAVTSYTTVIFAKYNNTPVVKATTRELSYIILVGFFMCYATTFVIVAKPTTIGCYIMRILPNTAFAMIYGALLTKTNRIARILSGSKKRIMTKKPRFMSTTAQLVITAMLVGLELSITTAILIYEPASAQHDYSIPMRVELVCKTTTLSFLAPYGFDFFLVISCTFYAVKTRNLPENFNEAKFIGFTMYTTCVIWLAFCSIYFGSNNKGMTMSLSFTLSASVALVLLFFPKLYIIIVKPERNVRSSYTTTKTIRCHFGKGIKDPLSQSVRSTTDSGIELASVRHRRAMTRESLQPQMSRHIDGDSRSFGVNQSANSLSINKTKIDTYKTVTNNSSFDESPDRKSTTTVASVNFHKTTMASSAPHTFPGPPTRSILMDFEPNELSVIEESMVSSHEESTNSAQTTKIEMCGHRSLLAQRSSASVGEGLKRFEPSGLADRACQTDICLSDNLVCRDRRKKTPRRPPGLGSSSVSNSRENLDNSFLHRAFSEYGKHLKKRLTFREFEQLFISERENHHVLEDDSFESLLSARLRQMKIDEAKRRRSVLIKSGNTDGVPFLEDDIEDNQEISAFEPDSGDTSNTNRQKTAKHPFLKRDSSAAVLSIARGLEDSLQAAMGTLVNAQANNLLCEESKSAQTSDSRKLSKTSVCSIGSKSDQPKRSLLGNLLATSIDTVTAVVCDTLQLADNDANTAICHRRESSAAVPVSVASSPSPPATGSRSSTSSPSSSTRSTPGGVCGASDDSSSAAGRSSVQSSTIFGRWGETLKKRVRRLGSENSSGSGGKTAKTPPACIKSFPNQPPLSRLSSTSDQQPLKLLQEESLANSPARLLDTVVLYEPPAIPENWSSPPPRDEYSFTELASARHRQPKKYPLDNSDKTVVVTNDDSSAFTSILESRGLAAKDMSHSTIV